MFIILSILVASIPSFSQDVITKTDGTDIQAQVLEVGKTEIRFKKWDNLEGPIFTELKSELLMIRYKNGTKDTFAKENQKQVPTPPSTVTTQVATVTTPITTDTPIDNYCEKGKSDAKVYYTGQNSGSGSTSAATILLSPLAGSIIYAACFITPPKPENLHYPSVKLYENNDYRTCYTSEAHTIKRKKLGLSIGISSAIWLGLILILNSSGG